MLFKLMFQPGEEQLLGAKTMIEAGVLENPKVDAAAMFHIDVQGKCGHGAMPQDCVDPLNVIAHIHLAGIMTKFI